MTEVVKKVAKTRRSVLGESIASATDPIGAHQLRQEEKGTAAAAQADATAAAVAEALAGAETERMQTLIDPAQMPTESGGNAARRSSRRQQLTRRGRASTILTSYDDALGGET